MPRRKPKHLFQPGQSGNPNGRPPGASSKIVIGEKVREAFAQLLDNNIDQLEGWLHALAKKNPEKALDIWVRISERFVPSLQRTEITGAEGTPFNPITINLPNIPKVEMSVGEGSLTGLPENPGNSLLPSPEEEIKALPEAQTPLDLGEGAPIPQFNLPSLQLTPNQLRDLGEMGEFPPGEAKRGDGGTMGK